MISLKEACLHDFHDLGAEVVIFTRSGGMVTVSDGSSVEEVGPLARAEVKSVTGARDAFWSGLLVAHLDGHGLAGMRQVRPRRSPSSSSASKATSNA